MDFVSIQQGATGYKGRVHMAVGEQLQGEYLTVQEVAGKIDHDIQGMYKLWPSNYIAHDELKGLGEYSSKYSPDQREAFLNRFAGEGPEIRTRALAMYAQPVINQRALVAHAEG